jgi:UDP:flavonoid glycosyltransferase YjiC (YdhE family)
VVCEAFDAIGPMIAAELGVPWYQVGVGPGVVAAIGDAIERTAVSRYSDAGLDWVDAAAYLDPCPPLLQDPQWSSRVPVLPVRARAHRRPRDTAFERPVFADPTKPTVLVTLGTIFSDPDTLAATVRAVAGHDVNVIATLGSSMRHTAGPTDESASAGVAYVPFVPLGQLLDGADLLVGSGGSGTVLAALANGLPMVLWPQGADQPINAARAADAGTSITVGDAAGISTAVARVLAEDGFRRRAQTAANEIADRPSPTDVVKEITSR